MRIQKKCRTCGSNFLVKGSIVKAGYGKFCSRKCSHESMRKGKRVKCFTCQKEIYKQIQKIKASKSRKYFCNKSCQTKWRNKVFSGDKHKLWKGGFTTYRDILKRNNFPSICILCKADDIRVLAVHHIDENHKNNDIKNLAWLCHNCHYLVHNFKAEKDKFELLRVN